MLNGREVIAVLTLIACVGFHHARAANYDYLECYQDSSTNRDLNKSEITFPVGDLTVDECVGECVLSGWPYVGLQEGKKCFCGASYGKHGAAQNIACNYTCNGDTEWCGGKTANSVYYTIRTDADSKAARSLVAYHTEPKNYESARQQCIRNNGDLAIAKDSAAIDEIVDLFTDAELNDNQKKIWFGLRRRLQPNGAFEWTDPIEEFTLEDYESYWQTDESWQNSCVLIDIDTKKWETNSCFAEYPYVCFQSGSNPIDTDYPDGSSGDVVEEEESGTNTLALAIVLPIFALCYGGSCLLYCIHKLYRSCKRKRHALLDKEEGFSEFEPDTKPVKPNPSSLATPPPTYTTRPNSFSSGGVSSSDKGQVNPSMEKEEADNPADESQPEPSSPVAGFTARSTEQPMLTQFDERKQRAEKRRTKLLQNALKEARERRAREQEESSCASSLSARSLRPKGITSPSLNESVGSSAASPVPAPPNEIPLPDEAPPSDRSTVRPQSAVKQASPASSSNDFSRPNSVPVGPAPMRGSQSCAVSPPPPPASKKHQAFTSDSGSESMSSLMNDERRSVESSSPDDPTKMSISDIIKVKMMMKEKKKRVKKILTC